MKHPGWKLNLGLLTLVTLTTFSIASYAAAPYGWFIAGSKPESYECGLDHSALHNDDPSAYLKANDSAVEGFGTLMQNFRADHYAGKRIRFSAFVKSAETQNWAGLWMRVDKAAKTVAFDNMHDRPIKGTSDWHKYDVVLDVPEDATGIYIGVLLNGSGEVWLSDANIEVVGPDVSTTGEHIRLSADEPINLDFRQ